MMKYRTLYSTLLLCGLSAACQKSEPLPQYATDDRAVKIAPEIVSAYTKSNPLDDKKQTVFNTGDCIGLVCEDGHVTFELDASGWNPTDNYYLRWGDEPVTYHAFYPASDNTTTFESFTLPSSQRTETKIALADYMTCTVENAVKTHDGYLPVMLKRKTSRVSFVVSDVEEGKKLQGVKISSYSGIDKNSPAGSRIFVTPFVTVPENSVAGQNGTVYTAIVIPCAKLPEEVFISLYYDGKEMNLTGIPELKEGFSYEFPLSLKNNMIALGIPVIEPWTGGATISGDAVKEQLSPLFVTTDADGNGDGLTWDTALSLSQVLDMIANDGSNDAKADTLHERKFYFACGEYKMPKDYKIEYSRYRTQVKIELEGGYKKLTGTDLEKTPSPSKLIAPSKLNAFWFTIGNQANPVFRGFEFHGGETTDRGTVFMIAAGGTGDAVLDLENCSFTDCKAQMTGKSDYNPSSVKIYKGFVRLNNVIFDNCRSENGIRGGQIRLMSGAMARLYMNNCRFHKSTAGGGGWGLVLQAHDMQNIVCMNNTTISYGDNGCGALAQLNGAGAFCISNSTIVSRNKTNSAALRCDAKAEAQQHQVLVNSILINEKDGNTLEMSGSGAKLHSYGGNIFIGKIIDKGLFDKAPTDDNTYTSFDSAKTGLGLSTDLSDYSVRWNGPSEGMDCASVIAAIKNFSNPSCGIVPNGYMGYDGNKAGEDFASWLESINAFDSDCYGNSRNKSSMWPGSYEK